MPTSMDGLKSPENKISVVSESSNTINKPKNSDNS